MHRGVDYAGAGVDHQPISVIKPGKVVSAGWEGAAGYMVVIDHNDGTTSKYFHLKAGSIKVSVGQDIVPGQVIGIVGNTGRSEGTHLHFEVWRGKTDLNDPHKLADNYFRFGGNVRPTEVQKLAKKDGKEGYINYKGVFVEKKWTAEQKNKFETERRKQSQRQQPPGPTQQTKPPTHQQLNNRMGLNIPEGEPYMIKGKMYYVDFKDNKIRTLDGKGNIVEIQVGRGKNEWILKEIREIQKIRKNQKISFSKISPTLPDQKYASYEQLGSQEGEIAFQPLIYPKPIPVPVSSDVVAYPIPSISNTDIKLT